MSMNLSNKGNYTNELLPETLVLIQGEFLVFAFDTGVFSLETFVFLLLITNNTDQNFQLLLHN